MKLLQELTESVQVIKEDKDSNGKKQYIIQGVFIQAETPNRNGRVYPMHIIKRVVNNYIENYINKNRALAELGHPEGPQINPERVSHIIKELKFDGNDVIGKAKILDTPYGKIVKNFMDEGISIGVSTRGLGSLKERNDGLKEVQDDFQLNAIDIVTDPSAPKAFVENIMENTEWFYENGILKVKQIEEYKKQIRKASKRKLEETILSVFSDFMKKI